MEEEVIDVETRLVRKVAESKGIGSSELLELLRSCRKGL